MLLTRTFESRNPKPRLLNELFNFIKQIYNLYFNYANLLLNYFTKKAPKTNPRLILKNNNQQTFQSTMSPESTTSGL